MAERRPVRLAADDPLRTLAAARRALDSGGLSARELLGRAVARNRELDAGPLPVHAFLSLTGADDREAGMRRRAADREGRTRPGGAASGDGSARNAAGALAGIPVAVKDNLCTLDLPTTCGSRILEGWRSPYEATAVRRLRAAGARLLGKANLDEFAMGSSTENGAFGPTRNPVDRSRVPGGSSGGSAAAVAAGVVPAALGSSTGGSVRQPAAFCGVVGVKPTYGRVSRYGLVAFASSLDCVGVLARTVRDAAVVLEAVAGPDALDATCRDLPPPRASALDDARLAGSVIGVPREYFGEGLHPGVAAAVERTLALAADADVEVREVSLPATEAAIPCYYVIAPAEASSNLARYDGVRYGRRARAPDLEATYARSRGEGFGAEVKRRILVGTYVLSAGYRDAFYLRAQRIRRAIADDFRRAFRAGVDALLAPTAPTPAFRLGERTADPYAMYLADVYTVSANLAGIPAVSLPVGEVGGLPVGAQLMGPAWGEERLLGLAARLEERIGWRHPLDREAG